MKNKTYDVLKWVCLVVLPATTTFYLTLAHIWGWPYSEAIGATLTAATAFMGAILGISSVQYAKALKAKASDDHVDG